MPNPLTEQWIKEQLELCEKSTDRPWWTTDKIDDPAVWGPDGDLVAKCRGSVVLGVEARQNAIFIAAAREGYPLVLRELASLRQRHDELIERYEHTIRVWCH